MGLYLNLWTGQCHNGINSFSGMKLHPKYKKKNLNTYISALFCDLIYLPCTIIITVSSEAKFFKDAPSIICLTVDGPHHDTFFLFGIFVSTLEVHRGRVQPITRDFKIKLDIQ